MPRPASATRLPIAPSPKIPSVLPRRRCDVAARRQHQGERELGGRRRRIALAGGDRDPELGAGGKIDGRGPPADQREQAELRQPLEQGAGETHALPDGDDHLGVAQPLDQLFEGPSGRAVARHVVVADQVVTGELVDHVLVVVRDDDFHMEKVLAWR
jgi:hypothetical protein